MDKLKQFFGWLLGGLSVVLFALLGMERKKNRRKDEQLAEQAKDLAQKESLLQATELIRQEEGKLFDSWQDTEQAHAKEQATVQIAEAKEDAHEAVRVANDIVARFNDRHQLYDD